MTNTAVAGFWSYAHDDNKLDGGGILELARLIMEEYNLLTGEPLELFIDSESIEWGNEWRQRIEHALSETTFFIPIITPRYFVRDECRRELLEFTAKAKSLGIEELILPILYIETPNLSAENPDEAVALVARMQYADWCSARFLEPNSREYRSAVNALARRLVTIAEHVSEKQVTQELAVDPSNYAPSTISDSVQEITTLLPRWLDAVLGSKFYLPQSRTLLSEFGARTNKLQRSRASRSAIMALELRFGKEYLPLMRRYASDARTYSALSIKMDPLVSTVARLVEQYPDCYELAAPIREAIDEAMESIQQADTEEPNLPALIDRLAAMRHISRTLQQCYSALIEAVRLVKEGNAIVRRWDTELIQPQNEELGTSEHPA